MKFLVFILFILSVNSTTSGQQITSVRICSDDYRYSSYPLRCARGQLVQIVNVFEVFIKQNTFPDCNDNGFNFNFSKPFVDYCNARESCEINAKFLEQQKLFSAETYLLADTSLYNIPFRIDINYKCSTGSVKLPITTTSAATTSSLFLANATLSNSSTSKLVTTQPAREPSSYLNAEFAAAGVEVKGTKSFISTNSNNTMIQFTTTQQQAITINNNNNNKNFNYFHNHTTTNHINLINKNAKHSSPLLTFSFTQSTSRVSSTTTTTTTTTTTSTTISSTTSSTTIKSTTTTTSARLTSKSSSTTTTAKASISLTTSSSSTTTTTVQTASTTSANNILKNMAKVANVKSSIQYLAADSNLNTTSQHSSVQSNQTSYYLNNTNSNDYFNSNGLTSKSSGKEANNKAKAILVHESLINNNSSSTGKFYKLTKPTGLTTRYPASGNADTDRTVMIILIVLGAIFFSIIFAIIILICIRKHNQKKMDREFVYKSDKISTNSTSSVQYGISTNGSLNEKAHLPAPFTATSSSSAIRGFETNLNELNGTYRARNNLAFENSQDHLTNQLSVTGGLPPKLDKKANKKARVDFDEYWRTNI